MCFVILRDLPFFWPFCEAYTRNVIYQCSVFSDEVDTKCININKQVLVFFSFRKPQKERQ